MKIKKGMKVETALGRPRFVSTRACVNQGLCQPTYSHSIV